jgi:DNA-binding MarR family transcriptional regulator
VAEDVSTDKVTHAALAVYTLDGQVGFLMRQAYQRHAALFAERFGEDITPTQWAVVAKLAEVGECSQNLLGRMTAMDVATVKGVVERLLRRKLIATVPDGDDRRRLVVSLTADGRAMFRQQSGIAQRISDETLAPLSSTEQVTFLSLLKKLR